MGINKSLLENNYLYVPNFISRCDADHLSQELYEAERCGLTSVGDTQAPNSSAIYDFLPFVKLLVRKVPHVSYLIQEDVLPTYCYSRIYKHGEILVRHRDRDACEISLTLNLFQDVEWPIYIQKPNNEEVALNLKPGDAMLYLGCDAEHWREVFVGQNYGQVFMHYVRANGNRAYAYFDKERR